jgi:subtilisin family serine protease
MRRMLVAGCGFLFLTFSLVGLSDPMESPESAKSDPQIFSIGTKSYIGGSLLVQFAPEYMPQRNNISFSECRFGIANIDEVLAAHDGLRIEKVLPTWQEASSPGGQRLERTFIVYYADGADPMVLANDLRTLPYFDDVILDEIVVPCLFGEVRETPTDPNFSDFQGNHVGQWNLEYYRDSVDIDAPEAWAIEKGDEGIVLCISDTGTMLDTLNTWNLHSDIPHYFTEEDNSPYGGLSWADYDTTDAADGDSLAYLDNVIGVAPSAVYKGSDPFMRSFVKNTPVNWARDASGNVLYCEKHGLKVASIAAARAEFVSQGSGMAGIANGCRVYFVLLPDAGQGISRYLQNIIAASDFASVINMSWGLCDPPLIFRDVIEWAANYRDIVLVASVGNISKLSGVCADSLHVIAPAKYEWVLGVANMDSTLRLYDDSCYGDTVGEVSVVAPVGHGVPAASHSDCDLGWPCEFSETVELFNGTSAASPQVAGLAALVRSRFPSLDQAAVRQRIMKSAEYYWTPSSVDSADTLKFGAGKINAYRTLTEWGAITTNVMWDPDIPRDGTYYISGDMTIENGGSLTINAGTTIKVAPDHERASPDTNRVIITVASGGTLNISGTANEPVVFESFTDSSPTTSDWIGIDFETCSSGTLEHVTINNAKIAIKNHSDDVEIDYARIESCETGIETWDDISIAHSLIRNCDDYGVMVRDETTTLSSDTLAYCELSGIGMVAGYQGAPGVASISSCYIHHNGDYGVHVSAAAESAYVSSSTIRDNAVGIAIADGRSSITNSTISSNDYHGVLVYSSADVTVFASEIDSNATNGIYCLTGSDIDIRNNTIQHSIIGVYCYDVSSPTICDSNVVRYNSAGIKCENESSPTISWNLISNNTSGVAALYDSAPILGDCGDQCADSSVCGGNSIIDNSGYHVSNLSEEVTILAECNYWGPRGPLANKFYGPVDYSPPRPSRTIPDPVSGAGPEEMPERLPLGYAITQNIPNPFNPITNIRFEVPKPGDRISIVVFDVQGKVVKRLYDGYKPAGYHTMSWDGTNEDGAVVATGVYFVQMRAREFVGTRKMILIK